MPIYAIYHAAPRMDSLCELPLADFPKGWEHVANVECNDADEAYEATQNAFKPWAQDERVKLLVGDRRKRSTSVGDVIVECHMLTDDTGYRVASVGFEEFTPRPDYDKAGV